MPPLEVIQDPEKVTLWEAAGFDESGRRAVYPPVEIDVRWVTKRRTVFDAAGSPIGLSATVTTMRKITPESIMWRGRLAQWTGTLQPGDNELMKVYSYDETPDVKQRDTAYGVSLVKYSDTLPTVVTP